jgi:hypothetical protein
VGPSWRRLAVGPIPPADWGTRSTRSHLGKRPEHESPDFCSRRWCRRCTPCWARSPRKGLGAKGVWVRVGPWRGSDRQHRRRPRKGKKTPQKLERYPVCWRPQLCPCGPHAPGAVDFGGGRCPVPPGSALCVRCRQTSDIGVALFYSLVAENTETNTNTSSQTKNRKKPQSDALPLQRHACRLSCWVRRAQDALYYWHASARPAGHKQRSAQRAKRKRTNEASWSSVLSQTPSSFLFFVWSCWGGALSPAAEKRGAPHARTPHAPRPARTHLPPVPGTPVMPVGPTCVYVAAVSGALAAAVAPPACI